jgi:osmoprotectant transport system permease protein
MKIGAKSFLTLGLLLFVPLSLQAGEGVIRVGSKVFTESYVLGEIAAQVIEQVGEARVERRFGLGGTGIVEQALLSGSIDLYPEYTGTIAETHLLQRPEAGNLIISQSLGFNNTYALALRGDYAQAHALSRISDLKRDPAIHAGLSHEFMERPDGYPGLVARYGLRLTQVDSISHSLALDALASGGIDLTDVYSTDAKIGKFGLQVLIDDGHLFPEYAGVWLARAELGRKYPKTWAALKRLEGRFSNAEMIRLNREVDIDRRSFADVAAQVVRNPAPPSGAPGWWPEVRARTVEHLKLVFISLLASLLVGLPLGIAAFKYRLVRQPILLLSGVVQTIPSLALLCFLIPVFGIGTLPALVALFLYALLPIVANTYTGLATLDPRLIESAKALGLTPGQRLRLIELPLASPSILTGVRTSAIISVGTATLAALIGAGGYGAPIVTGLALNDQQLILQGAIPAAVLSLLVQGLFEGIERVLVPASLRSGT